MGVDVCTSDWIFGCPVPRKVGSTVGSVGRELVAGQGLPPISVTGPELEAYRGPRAMRVWRSRLSEPDLTIHNKLTPASEPHPKLNHMIPHTHASHPTPESRAARQLLAVNTLCVKVPS